MLWQPGVANFAKIIKIIIMLIKTTFKEFIKAKGIRKNVLKCNFICISRYNKQARSESTSSVAFQVLIINYHIEFMNLFIFNCLTSIFCFPKDISFASRRERLFMDEHPSFRIWNWWPVIFERQIIFKVLQLVHEYTKMRIPSKRYQTNTFRTFWGNWSASALRYFGVDRFGKSRTKICGKQEKL